MKRILFLTLLVFSFSLLTPAQSRTNRLYRPCAGSTTPATVSISVSGNITATPCSGGTVTINGVKVYRALLTQTGTAAPTAVVLENSLGGTVVWTRSIAGTYIGTLTGAFPTAKTFLKQSAFSYISGPADDDVLFAVQPNTVNSVSVLTMTGATSAGVDAYLTNTPVEILVYP